MTSLLRAVAPPVGGQKAERQAEILAAVEPVYASILREHDIDTTLRIAHFVAQTAHESAGFTAGEENLNYSAGRLCQVWPSRFRTLEAARPYAGNPRKLANYVYGGRMGNVEPDDGWRFRGRGAAGIGLTGRENYERCGRLTGLDLIARPELAADPVLSVRIACAYWTWKGCSIWADRDNLRAVTRRVNGGLNGLADRQRYLTAAKEWLGAQPRDHLTWSVAMSEWGMDWLGRLGLA